MQKYYEYEENENGKISKFLEHFCLPAGSLYSVAVQYFPLQAVICDLYSDFRYDFCDLAQADSRHTGCLGPIIDSSFEDTMRN